MSDQTENSRVLAARAVDTSVTGPLGKYHVLGDDAPMTACGRLGSCYTREAKKVTATERCQKPGCRNRWPT